MKTINSQRKSSCRETTMLIATYKVTNIYFYVPITEDNENETY